MPPVCSSNLGPAFMMRYFVCSDMGLETVLWAAWSMVTVLLIGLLSGLRWFVQWAVYSTIQQCSFDACDVHTCVNGPVHVLQALYHARHIACLQVCEYIEEEESHLKEDLLAHPLGIYNETSATIGLFVSIVWAFVCFVAAGQLQEVSQL